MMTDRQGFCWGVAAILLWGLLTALSRSLLENLGMFTAGGCIYMLGGLLLFFLAPPSKQKIYWCYHGKCGLLCIAYLILYSVGLGLAQDRIQTVEMNLINYMWPLLTLLFSVMFFKRKASAVLLIAGILLALCGLAVSSSVLSGIPLNPINLWKHACQTPWPYLMMSAAAVSWGFYSNVLNSVAPEIPRNALSWFLFLGGVILFLLRYAFHETSIWNWSVAWQLIFIALGPVAAGYYCWDKAMLAKNPASSITFSYMTPLFSAIFCAILLRVSLPFTFYVACLLVIAGALVCRKSLKPEKTT